jgi:hypothetical protein
MKRRPWILALLLVCAPRIGVAQSMVLDVSPLRFHLQVKPGAEYTNAISVTNTGPDPVRLRSYLSDWKLDEWGTPVFYNVGSVEWTSAPWVDLAPLDFLLEPGETEKVRFTVNVPDDMPGAGYHSALMLENVPLDRAQLRMSRVFVVGRVACMLYVTVGNPPRSMKITSMIAGTHESGPYMDLVVENTGKDFIRLAGDARLVFNGGDEGDLVELPDVPVLPGGTRRLVLDLPGVPHSQGTLARVTINLPEIGVLVGECPLFFDRAENAPR